MFANYLEALIVAFIMIGLGVLIWRGGAKNPVGTGGLDRKLVHVDGELKKLGHDLTGIRAQVGEIENRVEDIESRSAKTADIRKLEKQLQAHSVKTEEMARTIAAGREDGAAMRASMEHTRRQIDLLYQHIVEKGMKS